MIRLNFPENSGIQVVGNLYEITDGTDFLRDDMLHIVIGPFGIHVGWDPEHDETGEYLVTVYRGSWDNILEEHATQDPPDLAAIIEDAVRRFSGVVVNQSASSYSTAELELV